MNRLILIGNGFDLAHGLKTSYNDFIVWYLCTCFSEAFEKNSYSDELIEITKSTWAPSKWTTVESVKESIVQCYNEGRFADLIENRWFTQPENVVNHPNPITVSMKAGLLNALLLNCSLTNWVDIENQYYLHLKAILLHKKEQEKEDLLEVLNHSLTHIISHLENYLNTLPVAEYNEAYMHIITSPILKNDVHGIELSVEEEPESTLILNFNYTLTIKPYLDWFHRRSNKPLPDVNFIHGRIKDRKNPLIFGFGDELDDAYLAIERETAKGYFDYIKSFWYLRTSNHRELTRFTDSGPFQVNVLGHSCGLSDRTMLHMIFEHLNCKSIKIYYHQPNGGDNNFTALTHEIARHFKDKGEMRNRIVSLDRSFPMPQNN